MTISHDNGCAEYNALSRRGFLGAVGAAALAGIAPAWLPQVAYAQNASTTRDVMVSIFLRGGADGLSLCVPYGDNNYYAARPTIAVPRPDSTAANKAIDLNGYFGLSEAMGGLKAAYDAKHLAVVHATGSTDPTRSHFDAQRFMELGKPEDPSIHTGWLGRHLHITNPLDQGAPLRALSLGYELPLTLAGADKALPVPDPSNFGLSGSSSTQSARAQWLTTDYSRGDDPVRAAALNSFNTIALLKKLNFSTYAPGGGAVYPASSFGRSLKAAAVLIKAQVGVEAIHVDIGGWDTHTNEGPLTGHLAQVMKDFADSIAAFHADIFSGTVTNVTLAAVSEFGRNVRENASHGTDHGHGNCMFVLGGGINGGKVFSKWPGLAPEQLYGKQDLDITIDYRDILAEIVEKRLGDSNLDFVFPGYTPALQGITV